MKFRLSAVTVMAFAGIVSMSSCVKKYNCKCETVYKGIPDHADKTSSSYDIRDSRSGAQSTCEGKSSTVDENGIYIKETCTLN